MAQILSITELTDRGVGVDDLDASGEVVADTEVQFTNDGSTMIHVFNGSAGAITVTAKSVPDGFDRGGIAANDFSITVPAGSAGMMGFLNGQGFGTNGIVSLEFSGTDPLLKCSALRLRKII